MTEAVVSNLNAEPAASLPMQASTTATFWGIGPDGDISDVFQDAYANIPGVVLRRADGTGASPTPVQAGDVVGVFMVRPWDGVHASPSGYLQFVADEAFDHTTSHGTHAELWVTPTGSTTPVLAAKFGPGAGEVVLFNLPTSDPANAGQLWNNAGALSVSAG